MVIGVDVSRGNTATLTGVERYALEVAKRLPTLYPTITFRFYAREALHPRWGALPMNVQVCVLSWPFGMLWTHLRLSWELWRHRPDVLFIPASAIPLYTGTKVMTTIHDIAFEQSPETYDGRTGFKKSWLLTLLRPIARLVTGGRFGINALDYQRWSVRQAIRRATVLTTVSQYTKQEIVRSYHVEPSRVTVVHSAADDPGPTPSDAIVVQGHPIPDRYFLFIGRLETKKNIGRLLQAYIRYRQIATQPIPLVLAGQPGFGWEEARRFVPEGWWGTSVYSLGWVTDVERNNLEYRAWAMLFVTPHEGFGIPPLESMRRRVPVLAASSGALPEILGSAALFVSADDVEAIAQGMLKIQSDEQLRADLMAAGVTQAATYTWDQTAKSIGQLLTRLT